jgi:DNA-binding CsgD family transcriptional regulator
MLYVDKLITGWRSRYGSETPQMQRSALAEILSSREGDILKFIAQGLSNKEIAKTLAIAPETVKSHVKQIFVKLGGGKAGTGCVACSKSRPGSNAMNWATVQRQRGGSSLADDGGVNTEFWENTRCLKINDEKR